MYNLRHIDPLCMFRGYVVLIKNFVAQIHSVFQWLCYIMTAWIHSVLLVAMTFVYDDISL